MFAAAPFDIDQARDHSWKAALEEGRVTIHEKEQVREDPNFEHLAACKTSIDEFKSLIAAHVTGYTQKKRVVDRLQTLTFSLEAIETKIIILACLGMGESILDHAEQTLYDNHNHSVHHVKEKVRILNADLQAALEEGRVTIHEKEQVLEDLQQRLEAAEQAGEEELKAKLERGIAGVSNAEPYVIPMPDAMELDTLKKRLRAIHGLENKPWYEQRKLVEKRQIMEAIKNIEKSNQMWFETDQEFKQRWEHALLNVTSLQLEQTRSAAKDGSITFAWAVSISKRVEQGDRQAMEVLRQACRLPKGGRCNRRRGTCWMKSGQLKAFYEAELNRASEAYAEAAAVAEKDSAVRHPIRLGLALNHTGFQF